MIVNVAVTGRADRDPEPEAFALLPVWAVEYFMPGKAVDILQTAAGTLFAGVPLQDARSISVFVE